MVSDAKQKSLFFDSRALPVSFGAHHLRGGPAPGEGLGSQNLQGQKKAKTKEQKVEVVQKNPVRGGGPMGLLVNHVSSCVVRRPEGSLPARCYTGYSMDVSCSHGPNSKTYTRRWTIDRYING